MKTVLVTGATGLVGRGVVDLLLRALPEARVVALTRDPDRCAQLGRERGWPVDRVGVAHGDITGDGPGLDAAATVDALADADLVIHAAADTSFSRPLPDARRVNTEGTVRLLERLTARDDPPRFVYVSTAFVAGRLSGRIAEDDARPRDWVNAYEQSKFEAECAVRASDLPWVIVRPSTLVCDDPGGAVSQVNSVHRALRLFHQGLTAMLPGSETAPVDVVPADYVCHGVTRAALDPAAHGRTLHLCAGQGALPLGELLDRTRAVWAERPEWRARRIELPSLTDLETYRLFERTALQTADARLKRIVRSLSWFVPQLAIPKRFETTGADELLGFSAPPVRDYWDAVVRHLRDTTWTTGSPSTATATE